MESSVHQQQPQTLVRVNAFIRSVYIWMSIGLGLTAAVAFFVASNQALRNIILKTPLFFVLIIGELGLVFYLSSRIQKLKSVTATNLFLFYAALNGATLSAVLLGYTGTSIASTFFICSATFVTCSVYGMITKRDLTSIIGFLTMGLIGIIIASIVNMFIGSHAMQAIISYVGVLVFVGLTAYDTQKLKYMALTQPADLDAGVMRKGAIIGALNLYLDFINMFLFLLQIFGMGDD